MASYDVEAVRMERLAASRSGVVGMALARQARRAARFESENLTAYDGVIAVSEVDKGSFVSRYGFEPERILVIENAVDPDHFSFSLRISGSRPRVVFVSSLGYPPNRQAAWRLLRRIMPLVRRRRPETCLSIVGQQPEPALLAESDGVQTCVTGRVDDVRPYLARATVGCVPLLAGSGTKYKVLEALSAGVPLVCTPLSIEGLDLVNGQHVLLAETDEELAGAILRLLDDSELSAALARRGREEVERRHSWEAHLPRLDEWLALLLDLPGRKTG